MDDTDEIFDENSDELTIAKHDSKMLEQTRWNDGFRSGSDQIEQEGFDDGFLYSYNLICQLIFDFTYLKKKSEAI